MSRTIYIVGNDGSGKTTYARRLQTRAVGRGIRVARRHYYSSVVRRLLRGGVERVAGIRRKKQSGTTATGSKSKTARSDRADRKRSGLVVRFAIIAFLYLYQSCMGLEWRLRDCVGKRGVLIVDRSYVDDLVSISQALRISVPPLLLRWSALLFPVRHMVYLRAESEVEYARIVGVDLSPEFHREKGRRYAELVNRLQDYGVPVRYVYTAGRQVPESLRIDDV